VASRETILNYLDAAKQMEANLLLNCGPMENGQLRLEDEKVMNVASDAKNKKRWLPTGSVKSRIPIQY
jgi:hypothetical protein